MSWLKAHWKIPAAVLALLIVWGLWYARPVDIYTLAPEVRDPAGITIDVEELTSVGQEPRLCSRPFTPEDPEWETVLSEIEALRFRRPVSNSLLQFLDRRSSPLYGFQDGDYAAYIRVFGRDGSRLELHFTVDSWRYASSHSPNRYLPLKMQNGAETGLALCQKYWSPPESRQNVSRETVFELLNCSL